MSNYNRRSDNRRRHCRSTPPLPRQFGSFLFARLRTLGWATSLGVDFVDPPAWMTPGSEPPSSLRPIRKIDCWRQLAIAPPELQQPADIRRVCGRVGIHGATPNSNCQPQRCARAFCYARDLAYGLAGRRVFRRRDPLVCKDWVYGRLPLLPSRMRHAVRNLAPHLPVAHPLARQSAVGQRQARQMPGRQRRRTEEEAEAEDEVWQLRRASPGNDFERL